MSVLLKAALQYTGNGFSVIPVYSVGSGDRAKRPALLSWKQYQQEIADKKTVERWFAAQSKSLALVTGRVSGNLEALDFDLGAKTLSEWAAIVREQDPDLVHSLVLEKSPNGAHVFYRSTGPIPGNQKLCLLSIEVSGPGEHEYQGKNYPAQEKGGKYFITPCSIETRGEGGYCLVAPSEGYELRQHHLGKVPTIKADQRELLISVARQLNEWAAPETRTVQQGYHPSQAAGEMMPGADYDARGDVRALLQARGWRHTGQGKDGREHWLRPGKKGDKGGSATLTDGKVFHVFSSNAAPFEQGNSYGPFAVYAYLNHGGDYKEAARALAKEGYGTRMGGTPERPKESGPTMGDLRMLLDLTINPGQSFTAAQICQGLGANRREEKQTLYKYLSRLVQEGIIKRDTYKHGGFRKPLQVDAFDLSGDIVESENLCVRMPLDLHELLRVKSNHLALISGRYDAGKSSFLFNVEALNYREHKIIHFISPELDINSIKERMDGLAIERPHPHVKVFPMREGYEDLIPAEPCIILVDYIRSNTDPFDIDRQLYRLLDAMHGGVCFAAIQKHPGLDKPTGGQFAVHAPHHVILLDKFNSAFVCKIFKTKNEKDLEGLYRVFGFTDKRRLIPYMPDWKKGEIRWEKPVWKKKDGNADNADNADKIDVCKRGGPQPLI